MKAMLYLAAGILLASFTGKNDSSIDGIWMGSYRSDLVKEKAIVKFTSQDQIEFYRGDLEDNNKCTGTYKIQGDSVLLTFKTCNGEEYTMQGEINERKNFVDGVWEDNKKGNGSFYLQKQRFQEMFVQP